VASGDGSAIDKATWPSEEEQLLIDAQRRWRFRFLAKQPRDGYSAHFILQKDASMHSNPIYVYCF
jgi:hypothetical protein